MGEREPAGRGGGAGPTRRAVMRGAAASAAIGAAGGLVGGLPGVRAQAAPGAPAIGVSPASIPQLPFGVMSGDVGHDDAIVWARADRPARMLVEISPRPDLKGAQTLEGPAALPGSDYTARMDLYDLPFDTELFYRVRFRSLSDPRAVSEGVEGRLRTLPKAPRATPMRLGWSGDLCGQGYGIHPDRGGLTIFDSLSREHLDLFICSGDLVYADGPIPPELTLPGGALWRNLADPHVAKVAETQEEFYARYRYNLADAHLRAFNAKTPWLVQWDDHETLNNWYPGEMLTDPRYQERSVDLLAARARRAFLDYTPIRPAAQDPERIFRRFRAGPSLDVFLLDLRSYRGPNSASLGEGPSPILGGFQRKWLEQNLITSRATWKIVASDMPLGLVVPDGDGVDAVAGGEGPPRGREHEIAELLKTLKDNQVTGVLWVTADVHYAAAHHYHPDRARFKDFLPFWEFVAGPLNAGNFGPNALDDTFGPKVEFLGIPEGLPPNTDPGAGYQFYGTLEVGPPDDLLTVRLHKATGEVIYQRSFAPGG